MSGLILAFMRSLNTLGRGRAWAFLLAWLAARLRLSTSVNVSTGLGVTGFGGCVPDVPPPLLVLVLACVFFIYRMSTLFRVESVASSEAAWPAERWWTAYADPQLDALIDEAKRTFDVAKQDELMAKVHTLKGRTLGCWCKSHKNLDLLCHGDVLVALAEGREWVAPQSIQGTLF